MCGARRVAEYCIIHAFKSAGKEGAISDCPLAGTSSNGIPSCYNREPLGERILSVRFSLFRILRLRRRPAPSPAENDWALDPNNPFPNVVRIPFQDVLDLHSIPPRQVRAVVEDYLEEARRRRVRWVRIIHGKGIGAQREIVRAILLRTPFVVDFRDAPPEAGGWGATVATLSVEDEKPER